MFLCNEKPGGGQLTWASVPRASVLMFTFSQSHNGLFSSSILSVFQGGQRAKGQMHALAMSKLFLVSPAQFFPLVSQLSVTWLSELGNGVY